ncbi:hypothetical protein D4764_05G0003140 [Takifugu flavidus]|uniref:Uncharacterized protein n=1 Tax=Takifugu flavidus TaxID=433684 RepID=A0A5C6MY03_9TELE|nr:hypothetical protein D4764_05G0003140 [Takifugu flavidus]
MCPTPRPGSRRGPRTCLPWVAYQGHIAPDNGAPGIIGTRKPLHHDKVAAQGGDDPASCPGLPALSSKGSLLGKRLEEERETGRM